MRGGEEPGDYRGVGRSRVNRIHYGNDDILRIRDNYSHRNVTRTLCTRFSCCVGIIPQEETVILCITAISTSLS